MKKVTGENTENENRTFLSIIYFFKFNIEESETCDSC